MSIKGIRKVKIVEPLEDDKCIQFYSFFSRLKMLGQFPGLDVIHIANQQGRNKINYTKKLMRMGLKPGCPDYLVTYNGRYGWIEFKRHTRDCKLKDAQLTFQLECINNNIPHITTSTVDEAIAFLKRLMQCS